MQLLNLSWVFSLIEKAGYLKIFLKSLLLKGVFPEYLLKITLDKKQIKIRMQWILAYPKWHKHHPDNFPAKIVFT